MTCLIKELEAVVGLADKASNDEPWQVDQEGDVVCNGEDVAWAITNKLDAPYIAALNNLFRTHHAEIAEAVKDARRYRWLRNVAWSIPSIAQQELPAVAVFSGTDRRCKDISGEEMDQAIDAAITETENPATELDRELAAIDAHNSAREVGE